MISENKVDHPSYYAVGGIETIDFIEAKELNFNLGNVVKYVARCGHKKSSDLPLQKKALQDLEKAQWYIEREISRRRNEISQHSADE